MASLSGSMKARTVLIALSLITACASLPPPSADTVYVNGKIITVDKAFTIAQAVAVKDGRFVGVGTSDEMRRYVSPTTRVVDLKGRAVIPGLMDSHTHMLGAGAAETRAPLFRAKTVAEAQAIIADFIKSKNVPPSEWVQTSGWHPPSQLLERRYLTRQEIDAVAPNHPVFVQTVGHFAMANTKALELAGITALDRGPRRRQDLPRFQRRCDRAPRRNRDRSGRAQDPKPTFEQVIAQLVTAQRIYNQSGITSTIDAALSEEQMRAYFVVAERKQASVRAGLMWKPSAGTAEEFERALKAAKFKENQGDDWVRVSGIKIVSDGGMTLRSAYTRQAYAGEPHNHGTLAVDAAAYKQNVLLANRYGWRVGTHAVGDARSIWFSMRTRQPTRTSRSRTAASSSSTAA
jgi:predicted amidohydrolase YtcJ